MNRSEEDVARTHRTFSPEFKRAAVREVTNKFRTVADVARENGLVAQTLGNRLGQEVRAGGPGAAAGGEDVAHAGLLDVVEIVTCLPDGLRGHGVLRQGVSASKIVVTVQP
ncbi:transposase [Lapillicoccus sp.]|uniref:transposase n=1 Tax=Lapillicoccus sp. TaxID=1909287 RepID=UPI0025DE9590|nr:transposase [Lapillicoccus sp.]